MEVTRNAIVLLAAFWVLSGFERAPEFDEAPPDVIMRVAPMYTRYPHSQPDDYCDLEFTLTPLGTTADVRIIECTDAKYEKAAVQALLEMKLKPRRVNETAITVPGLRHRVNVWRSSQAQEGQRQRDEEPQAEQRRQEAIESGLLDDYKARVVQRIESNWVRSADSREDLIWVVLLDLLPGNEVAGIEFEQFNGTEADRRSIEAAIRRSSPLPSPPAPELFERQLRLRYPSSENALST